MRRPADRHYCIVCFPLPEERTEEVPALFGSVLRLPYSYTNRDRMGKVVLVSPTRICYYESGADAIRELPWSP